MSDRREYHRAWAAENREKRLLAYATYNASERGERRGHDHKGTRTRVDGDYVPADTMEMRVRRIWKLFQFPREFIDPDALKEIDHEKPTRRSYASSGVEDALGDGRAWRL